MKTEKKRNLPINCSESRSVNVPRKYIGGKIFNKYEASRAQVLKSAHSSKAIKQLCVASQKT